MAKSGNCRLTNTKGTFVKAHIVPRAFYHKGGKVRAFASDGLQKPKLRRKGLYDPELVIYETEKRILSPLDDYGISFLSHANGNWFALDQPRPCDGWLVANFDASRLKLFFDSVLWRAATSSRVDPAFELGSRELEKLRKDICSGSPAMESFRISLVRHGDAPPGVVMLPKLMEIDGVRGAWAVFGGYEVLWYLDEPGGDVDKERLLRANEPWLVLERPWAGSQPEQIMIDIAAKSINAV